METERLEGIANAAAVTPNDSSDLLSTLSLTEFRTRYGTRLAGARIFVGVTGNVRVTLAHMTDGTHVTLTGLQAGVWHPVFVKRVWSTGTTATSILAGW